MRGSFKKKKAKVVSISLGNLKVQLEGIQRAKRDGTKVPVKFSPRALQIQNLILEDRERIKYLDKNKSISPKKTEEIKESKQKETKNAPEKK